jgi:hypothetical protein
MSFRDMDNSTPTQNNKPIDANEAFGLFMALDKPKRHAVLALLRAFDSDETSSANSSYRQTLQTILTHAYTLKALSASILDWVVNQPVPSQNYGEVEFEDVIQLATVALDTSKTLISVVDNVTFTTQEGIL